MGRVILQVDFTKSSIMNQETNKPILIDFFALSGTGKSTHSKALFDYLTAKGAKVKIFKFALRGNGRDDSFRKDKRPSLSIFCKSISMGCVFWRLSSRRNRFREIVSLIKWSYRLLVYDKQMRSLFLEGLDYIIRDPSLSSKLKKFYKHFDDESFVEVISFLEEKKLTSDIVVFIKADLGIVKKRRLARGSLEISKRDSETFSLRKAFSEIEQRNTSMNFVTVDYDSFSSLEGNIQKIAEVCARKRSPL